MVGDEVMGKIIERVRARQMKAASNAYFRELRARLDALESRKKWWEFWK